MENPKICEIDESDVLSQFKSALEAQGFIIDAPIMNGKLQRCRVDGDRGCQKSGAYVGYLDGHPAGFIQNYKADFRANWKYEPQEASAFLFQCQKIASKRENRQLEIANLQEKTALRLEEEWRESRNAEVTHPYLQSKALGSAYDLRVDRFNNLLIPLRDINAKLWSLQRIGESGNKIIGVIKREDEKEQVFAARKKGCFYTQTPLEEHEKFFIAEGFATAMSLQEALAKPTIMAVDCGNLQAVVEALKARYPSTPMVIFADNDMKAALQGKPNVGVKAANDLQERFCDIKVVIPIFSQEEALRGMSDFNDIHKEYGLPALRKRILEEI